MKSKLKHLGALAIVTTAMGWLGGGTAWAGPISYLVTVDTSPASGTSGFLDFQFANGGAGTQAAFVTIGNFLTDGTLSGVPALSGGASGTLPGLVTINNSGGFNDYFTAFLYGSNFTFILVLDGPALQAPNGTSISGSTFALALFDSGINPILTVDPNGFAGLVDVNLDGSTTTTTFASGPQGAAPAVTFAALTPEPSTFVVGLGLLALALGSVLRKSRA